MRVRFAVFLLALLFATATSRADDVGIAEARLIEEDGQTYAMEVDIAPSLVRTIQRPRLPDRFSFVGDTEVVRVGPMLVLRFRFRTDGAGLGPEDEIVLAWQRSGIILTAYWLDGSSRRAFFDRELVGIRVPIRALREVQISQVDLLRSGVSDAFDHLGRIGWMHVILVLVCALAGPWQRMARLLLAFAAGNGISLVGADLGVSGFPPAIVTLLIGIAALLMFRATARNVAGSLRFWPLLIALGLLHGLSYSDPSIGHLAALSTNDLVVARFAFNTAVDLVHGVLGLAAWASILVIQGIRQSKRFRPMVIRLGGGLAVALVLSVVPDAIAPPLADRAQKAQDMSGTQARGGTSRALSRPVDVTDPLMGFVTVTAFEVRCEWLVRVSDLQPSVAVLKSGELVLPVDVQEAFKDELLRRFVTETMVTVDGEELRPSASQADFVAVSTYGVTTRPNLMAETVDDAVVGITLSYPVTEAPRTVSVRLSPYPFAVVSIPIAVADPWGSVPHVMTDAKPRVEWERRMAGFRRPTIRAVTVPPPMLPFVSAALLIAAAVIVLIVVRKRESRLGAHFAFFCCAAAILAYPFLRAPAPGIVSGQTPSEDNMHGALTHLLTNIYRAFDYRTEDAIYDRLSISATGDQLASIYLQHIRAMELENRGGARASVDDVEVQVVRDIAASENGLSVEAGWTVSGSVSHFGHTHYRKNIYRAVVYIVVHDGTWKINGIEILEEERVL